MRILLVSIFSRRLLLKLIITMLALIINIGVDGIQPINNTALPVVLPLRLNGKTRIFVVREVNLRIATDIGASDA